MNIEYNAMVSGALVMAYLIAGLFFLKFYRSTRDRLFLLFAWSFWILSSQRFALALTTREAEDSVVIYAVRLLAFLIILWAIIDKNISTKRAG